MSHVDEGRLHALLDGALHAHDPADAQAVELHLAACADCRARLEAAAALREEAGELLAVLPRVDVPPFQEIERRAAGSAGAARSGAPATVGAAGGAGAGRSRFARLVASPFGGMAWAATVVLAIGLGWLLRDQLPVQDERMTLPGAAESVPDRRSFEAVDAAESADAEPAGEEVESGTPAPAGDAPANQMPRPESRQQSAAAAVDQAPARPSAGAPPAATPPAVAREKSADVAAPEPAAPGAVGRERAESTEEQAAAAPPPPPPMPVPAPARDAAADAALESVAPSQRSVAAEGAVTAAAWRPVPRSTALEAARGRLAELPGAGGGAFALQDGAVRITQRLPNGSTVVVVQQPLAGERAGAYDVVALPVDREWNGWRVSIASPDSAIDADSLRALLRRLPER